MGKIINQDQQLREHPDATIRRLKRSGKWREAEKLLRRVKQSFHRKFKKSGAALTIQQRIELAAAAWNAVHDRFPPPKEATPLESLAAYVQSTSGSRGRGPSSLPPISIAAERRFSDIGETCNPVADAIWVYNNLDNGDIDPTACPSRGAWGLLSRARENHQWFFEKMYKQAVPLQMKQAAEQREIMPEISKAEQMAIADIREMIKDAVEESGAINCPHCGHKITPAEQLAHL